MARVTVIFRDARREDVPMIVAMLADDFLGAAREASRGAGAGDGSAAAGGAAAELDEAYWTAFDQIESDPRNRLIVAESDGRVAGTLQLTLLPGLSRHGMLRAQIEAVRIAAWTRGQGIGRQMITWAVTEARRGGCGVVQLTSDKRRADAIRFYESLGFEPSHEGLKLHL
jgi:GNAT superfamily N-acetyltransferase